MRLWEKGDSAEAMGWLPSPIGWDPVEQTWYCHSFVERYHRFVRPLFGGALSRIMQPVIPLVSQAFFDEYFEGVESS